MSTQPAKQALPNTEQRGSKRAAATAGVGSTEEEEIVILDSEPVQPPLSKKARTSAVGGSTDGSANAGVAGKEKSAAAVAVENGKKSSAPAATSKPSSSSTAGVKKTIFMPGFGAKPATPAIPAKLAETLSIPLPSASTNDGDSSVTATTLKRDFVDALPDDLKELLQMEIETMGDDWFVALRGEFVKPYFRELKKFVIAEQKSKKVFPPAEDVYSWTRLCPLSGIRVVVIGQDPYHDDGQAHGLAFSVRKGIRTPPSLRNIYKELGEEIEAFTPPSHGHLTSWARQGVLLLNTCLTVRAHEAASHSKKGWETFTTAVLKTIIDRLAPTGSEQGARGVVFLAWGAPAGKLCVGISEKSHHVLRSAHPSPLAASRGFFGNKHFVKCNEWLESKYGAGKGIDWTSVMRD